MTQREENELIAIFFKKVGNGGGCGRLNIENCKELRQNYRASLATKGCTACKRRRMKRKYSAMLRGRLKGKEYKEVLLDN